MKESLTLIQEKWDLGIYELKDMIILVKEEKISKEDFFEITRYNYDSVLKIKNNKFI